MKIEQIISDAAVKAVKAFVWNRGSSRDDSSSKDEERVRRKSHVDGVPFFESLS